VIQKEICGKQPTHCKKRDKITWFLVSSNKIRHGVSDWCQQQERAEAVAENLGTFACL